MGRLLWTFCFGFLCAIDLMVNVPTLYDASTYVFSGFMCVCVCVCCVVLCIVASNKKQEINKTNFFFSAASSDENFYAYLFGAYVLMQFFGAFMFGLWLDRRPMLRSYLFIFCFLFLFSYFVLFVLVCLVFKKKTKNRKTKA